MQRPIKGGKRYNPEIPRLLASSSGDSSDILLPLLLPPSSTRLRGVLILLRKRRLASSSSGSDVSTFPPGEDCFLSSSDIILLLNSLYPLYSRQPPPFYRKYLSLFHPWCLSPLRLSHHLVRCPQARPPKAPERGCHRGFPRSGVDLITRAISPCLHFTRSGVGLLRPDDLSKLLSPSAETDGFTSWHPGRLCGPSRHRHHYTLNCRSTHVFSKGSRSIFPRNRLAFHPSLRFYRDLTHQPCDRERLPSRLR